MSGPSFLRRLTTPLRLPRALRAMQAALEHQQQRLDELDRRLTTLDHDLTAARTALRRPDDVQEPYPDVTSALQARLDHALLHAEAVATRERERAERELASLRSAVRQTQAMVERASTPAAPDDEPASAPRTSRLAPDAPRPYVHPVPTFDLLYRSFEDAHRGSEDVIRDRLRTDYLDLVRALPASDLPIVDLGCGRGELVHLLRDAGFTAVGIDANAGQLVDTSDGSFVQSDLFDWLDAQPDRSVRAVFALHVIEHLPIDLQVRLMFEARRVLVDGGLVVIETPNALSISTAASNFWVDPTHHRPVHPLLLEFLASEAGLRETRLLPLHPVPVRFRGRDLVPELVDDLDELILGAGDIALIAHR